MKKVIFCSLVTMVMSISLFSQTAADRLYKDAVQFDNTFKLYVQRPLLKAGINSLKNEVGEGNLDQQLWKLASYTKHMKILVMDAAEFVNMNIEKANFLKELKEDLFEEYVTIRHKKSNVNILVREKRNKIRDILFLVMDNEMGLVMIDVKTKIPLEVLDSIDLNKEI